MCLRPGNRQNASLTVSQSSSSDVRKALHMYCFCSVFLHDMAKAGANNYIAKLSLDIVEAASGAHK